MSFLPQMDWVSKVYLACGISGGLAVIALVLGWSMCLGTQRRRGLYFVWISVGMLATVVTALIIVALQK